MRYFAAVTSLSLVACSGAETGSESTGANAEDLAVPCEVVPSRDIACVLDFSPGEGAGFGQEEFPEVIFGEPVGGGIKSGSLDVLSLGRKGSITVGFGSSTIVDLDGPDFIVFENPFYLGGNPDKPFAELGVVSVSEDGNKWTKFECQSKVVPYDGCAGWRAVLAGSKAGVDAYDPDSAGGDAFDLADIGVTNVRFVRIDDISNVGQDGTAGFDLDAITLVHWVPAATGPR